MSNLDALRAAIAATQNQPSTAPQADPKMDPKVDPKIDPPHPAVRLILPLDKMALVLSLVLTVGTVAIVAESQAPKPERAIASRVDHHFASARLMAGVVSPRDVAIAAFPVLNLSDLDLPTLARAAGPWIGWATFSLLFIRGMHRAHRPTETD
jgi:hypothetical protein